MWFVSLYIMGNISLNVNSPTLVFAYYYAYHQYLRSYIVTIYINQFCITLITVLEYVLTKSEDIQSQL
jgi:hypothetical protein